ncbi:non-homologous end-joining DNA ligase [Moorella naiadis]|uniref:non-homologous end-joining DNA ligase n=1 Tax=Moorella naiadis (nom. illeg.) TaxID=3093670 RepID=UPI003D9CB97D
MTRVAALPENSQLPVFQIKPMLAIAGQPFDSPDFLYEVKWDGYRGLAYLEERTILQSRNLQDITAVFPELADLHQPVRGRPAVLDGEIIIPRTDGKPSFSLLQARGRLGDPLKIRQAARQTPAIFMAFDILYHQGRNVMAEALQLRKEILQSEVRAAANLIVSQFILNQGISFYEACVNRGLEGVMAKELSSPYLPGKRSPLWRKFRHTLAGEFIIAGYEPGRGERALGALILASYVEGRLIYRGKVGTGFDRGEERELMACLQRLPAAPPPFREAIPELKNPRWVEPRLVCQVEYLEMTPQGRLRHPGYRGLRRDKEPEECSLP